MNKYITLLLIILLTFATAFPHFRMVGFNVQFMYGEGAGYPRLVEIVAILCIITLFPHSRKMRIKNYIYGFVFLLFVFALFKPFYMEYFRSACLIPSLLLAAFLNLKITDKEMKLIFQIIFYVITLSSFFVIISPYVDLGVSVYYADARDSSIQRYIGFGQSLPYQACYSLSSIPVFYYLQQQKLGLFRRNLNMLFLMVNVVAAILTGARTAFIILAVLVLFYYRMWRHIVSISYLVGIAVVGFLFYSYYTDLIHNTFSSRGEMNLAGRDAVWSIAIQLVLEHPIFGIQNFFVDGKQYGMVIAHVQNGFFEIIFWGGIFALILYVIIFGKLYKLVKPLSTNTYCFIGVMVIFLIFMLSEILFFSVQAYYLIIIICGLLAANSITNRTESLKEKVNV